MISFKLNQVLFLLFFYGYDCQRRIKGGTSVNTLKEANYVVYLLKAAISPQNYNGWLCGGTIVSPDYIVTSAACVRDVIHLYAIAGNKKYVKDTDIYKDACTNEIKKKIVLICTHSEYKLDYEHQPVWSNIDIAVVKVETPYEFGTGQAYSGPCSYMPGKIDINYDSKYQEPGIDAIVLGWGHDKSYRETTDTENHNQDELKYAPTLIQDKSVCREKYSTFSGMDAVIDNYMICADKAGNLNELGKLINPEQPNAQGCNKDKIVALQHPIHDNVSNADVPEDEIVLIENTRKDTKLTNFSESYNSSLINKINKTVLNSRRTDSDQYGICQNDHGGPLVTWIGAHETLIGVASVFMLNNDRECIGPYLYTSTQCNGHFLNCIVTDKDTNPDVRRQHCADLLNEKGLKLVERHISWKDHPDGPAENEKNVTTPVSAANTVTNNVTVKPPNDTIPVSAVNTVTNNVTVKPPNDSTPVLAVNTVINNVSVKPPNDSTPVSAVNTVTNNVTVNPPNDSTPVSAVNTVTNNVSVKPPNDTTPVSAVNAVTNNVTVKPPNDSTPVSAVNTVTNNVTVKPPNDTIPVSAVNTVTNNVSVKPPNDTTPVLAENTVTNNVTVKPPNDTTTKKSIIGTKLSKTTKTVNVGDS